MQEEREIQTCLRFPVWGMIRIALPHQGMGKVYEAMCQFQFQTHWFWSATGLAADWGACRWRWACGAPLARVWPLKNRSQHCGPHLLVQRACQKAAVCRGVNNLARACQARVLPWQSLELTVWREEGQEAYSFMFQCWKGVRVCANFEHIFSQHYEVISKKKEHFYITIC